MNEEYDNGLLDDQTIKGIINDLRLAVDQLGKDFIKAKDLIHELARSLDESKQCERDQVSRKIKEILKDKIREGKITAKWIEDCLPSEYKRKYTTKSEDTSLSKESTKEIEVDAQGNSISEPESAIFESTETSSENQSIPSPSQEIQEADNSELMRHLQKSTNLNSAEYLLAKSKSEYIVLKEKHETELTNALKNCNKYCCLFFDANGILLKIESDISRAGNKNDNRVLDIGPANEVTDE
jgi:hypothetical protein